MTKLEELKAAYEAANKPLPVWGEGQGKATHDFMEKQPLPLTLWETSHIWHGERLYRVEVSPITVVKYDYLPGAFIKTVEFKDSSGRRARGSVEMYYISEEAARAEANYYEAHVAKEEADANLIALMHENLPLLLEAVEALSELKQAVEFTPLGVRGIVAVDRSRLALEKLK